MLYEEIIHIGFKTWLLKALNSAKSSKLEIPKSVVRTQDVRKKGSSVISSQALNSSKKCLNKVHIYYWSHCKYIEPRQIALSYYYSE